MGADLYAEGGFMYYTDTDEPVLNKDGSHRKASGRPAIPEEVKKARNDLALAQKEKDRKAIATYKKELESRDLLKLFNKRDFDVVGRMMDMIDDTEVSERVKANLLLKMFDKAFPQLTAMNVNAEKTEAVVFNIDIPGMSVQKKETVIDVGE